VLHLCRLWLASMFASKDGTSLSEAPFRLIRLERLASDANSSLQLTFLNYNHETFCTIVTW
jgi:hypothetical protein